MKKVTAIRSGRGHRRQIDLLIDGKPDLNTELPAVIKKGLRDVCASPSAEETEPDKSDRIQRCLNTAVRFLRYRPRSEFEVRERLKRHGYEGDVIDNVIASLQGKRLIDDRAFVQFWKDDRDSFSPRSQRLIKLELKQKGVAGDIIDQEIDALDDTESAYRSAIDKACKLPRTDYQSFRRRLGEYLRRRGYGYSVIEKVAEQVCKEQGIIT